MSTRKLQLPVSGFTDGLNTEASVLNVLPSEMMDGSKNVELLQNGSVLRRRGIDFIGASNAGGFLQSVRTASISSELLQESPAVKHVILAAPNGNLVAKFVVDINNEFWVFDVTNAALSNIDSPTQTISRTVDGILHSYDSQKYVNMQFAQSGNRLFFAGKHIHPGYLQVAADNTSLEVVYLNVIVRDPDATAINSRVSIASQWYDCYKAHTSAASNTPGSGADWEQYWILNDGAIPGTVGAWAGATAYTTSMGARYDKYTAVGASDTFPTTVDFFAGRAWLSGDPKYPNSVNYSQVVITASDLEKYHQFADPFDTADSAIVADDGGVIAIQGAGLIKRLLAIGSSIFVGSNNGIRQIAGGGASSTFTATDFTTNGVLEDGIDGPENMVKVDDEFVVFGQDTIWRSTIQTNVYVSTTGQASFKSLSENRVETLYTDIPTKSKASARAVYNPSERRVYYYYNKESNNFDNSYNGNSQPGYAKDALILDTRFQDEILPTEQQQKQRRSVKGAFFAYDYNDGASTELPYIACPFISPGSASGEEAVTATGVAVTAGGVPVIIPSVATPQDVVSFLVLRRTETGANATIEAAFATSNTNVLKDWSSSSTYAISFDSPILAGVQTGGDALHNKNLTYIYFVFKRVESGVLDTNNVDLTPGGCYMATAWDFATDSDAPGHNKFFSEIVEGTGDTVTDSLGNTLYQRNPMREVYHPARFTKSLAGSGNDGYSHVYYKHRVRGRGHVFQILLLNDNDKDFHLVGWVEQFYGKAD